MSFLFLGLLLEGPSGASTEFYGLVGDITVDGDPLCLTDGDPLKPLCLIDEDTLSLIDGDPLKPLCLVDGDTLCFIDGDPLCLVVIDLDNDGDKYLLIPGELTIDSTGDLKCWRV